MSNINHFTRDGWVEFASDPQLLDWLQVAKPAALATRQKAEHQRWITGQGTWFVGVNALGNGPDGSIENSGPLTGRAMSFIRNDLGFGGGALDRAQVSICTAGFPKRRDNESDASFAFRRDRDGAHLDGLHPTGPDRRRKQLEYQGFLLGIPLTKADNRAAPLVIWRGSHKIMQRMYVKELANIPRDKWPEIDLTAPYHAARRQAFETCERVIVHGELGAAYVLHPMALHGVSPWQSGAIADPEGRAILYFRPEVSRQVWLETGLTDAEKAGLQSG